MTNLLPTGTILQNRYQILNLLGQGGMGFVYLARDCRLDKPCAVKETLDVSPQAQKQFSQEARLLARLNHAHLPRVTDYFAQTGRYYLVMDYVEGPDLEALVQKHGAAPPEQALAWADQVLDALDYLHRQSPPVIHRDVKPANIKVTSASGLGNRAVLVDFGIAKEQVPGQYTRTGARAFSPGYAPLEQYAAQGQTDARTDVYGLGATLYYLLAGLPPTEAPHRAAGGRLPPLREVNPRSQTPPEVEAAVIKALELQKQDRWQSARAMRRSLGQAARSVRRRPPAPAPGASSSPDHGPDTRQVGSSSVLPRAGATGTRVPAPEAPPVSTRPRREDSRPVRARPKQRETALIFDSKALIWILGLAAAMLVILLGLLVVWVGQRDRTNSHSMPTEVFTLLAFSQSTATLRPASVIPTSTSTPEGKPLPTQETAEMMPTTTMALTARATNTPTRTNTPPAPTATKTPTHTPDPAYPAPTLLEPYASAELSGRATFKWQWAGPALAENHYFDLRVWSEQEADRPKDQRRGAVALTKVTEAVVNNLEDVPAIREYGAGIYYWTIVVVDRISNEAPRVAGRWGEERKFVYTGSPSGPGPGSGSEPSENPCAGFVCTAKNCCGNSKDPCCAQVCPDFPCH